MTECDRSARLVSRVLAPVAALAPTPPPPLPERTPVRYRLSGQL
jgi:hypothetical protein